MRTKAKCYTYGQADLLFRQKYYAAYARFDQDASYSPSQSG